MKKQKLGGLVYSTESGRICPKCHKQADHCVCRNRQSVPVGDGVVRLMRETKGRKGKGVTLISGLPLEGKALKKLATSLKQKCGCGGSIKKGMVEIQGDQRDILEVELQRLGYKVKRAGG